MANPGLLSEINWEIESVFAEDVDTVATQKAPIAAVVDVSGMLQKKIDVGYVHPYRNEGSEWTLGTFEPTFKVRIPMAGHGSTTAGAVSKTTTETFHGYQFGNSAVCAASGTTLTGGTANIPTTTASGTFSAGALAFIGALGDTDGEGQAYAIATHSGTNLTLLTDLQGAPQNGAVLYSGTMIYPSESPTSTTIQSLRMQLATANMQYLVHGCYPTAVAFTGFNPGDVPYVEYTFAGAWYEYKASTFPSSNSGDTSLPAATAAGSLFCNTVGTTTNARRTYRNLTIEYTLGVATLRGPGGVNAYQDIVGCRRTRDTCKWTWTEDADAATTTPTLPGFGTSTNKKHLLLTLSTADGSRNAFYSPRAIVSNVAAQRIDDDINRFTIECMTQTGLTSTNDLTLSHFRWLSA